LTAYQQNSMALADNPPFDCGLAPDPLKDLRDAIHLLANITEAFTVALYLREPGEDYLRPVVWHTLSGSFRSEDEVMLGEGLVGYVAKHQAVVDVDRFEDQATATRLYDEDEGIQAFLAMPVGKSGVLVVDTKTRRIFGEREKKIVRDFANFMANLAVHMQTCDREKLYGRILDLLYEVENATMRYNVGDRQFFETVLKAGMNFTGLSMGFFCLFMPTRNQYLMQAVEGPYVNVLRGRSFDLEQGLVGWIFKERRPLTHSRVRPLKGKSFLIHADEPMRDYNAFMGTPLMAWRKLTGVWAFAGNTDRVLDKEEEQALQLAGNRVAATMEYQSKMM
jgi:signal transduction protein with GAF and PtsI domain